jgi:hypothetical protein
MREFEFSDDIQYTIHIETHTIHVRRSTYHLHQKHASFTFEPHITGASGGHGAQHRSGNEQVTCLASRDLSSPPRAQEDYGGALCKFTQELEDKKAYDKPLDGFELFCSAQQVATREFVTQ